MIHLPRFGHEENQILEIYNASTSEFARFTPGAFDFIVSAWLPDLDQVKARRLFFGLQAIHEEFIRYNKMESKR